MHSIHTLQTRHCTLAELNTGRPFARLAIYDAWVQMRQLQLFSDTNHIELSSAQMSLANQLFVSSYKSKINKIVDNDFFLKSGTFLNLNLVINTIERGSIHFV